MKENGATLIETMLAAAVLVMIFLGTSQLYTSQIRQTALSDQQIQITNLQKEIYTMLSNETNCLSNFLGQSPIAPAGFLNLRDSSGAARIAVGARPGPNLLVSAINKVAAGPIINPNGKGKFHLEVLFTNAPPAGVIGRFRLPVFVEVDAASLIMSCATVGSERTDCRYVSQGFAGASSTVSCPVGFRVVGGGLSDSDFSKGGFRSLPIPANPPITYGGWSCFSADPDGTITCWATCCR